MKVSLRILDEWLFKGLGGIVNMLMTRITRDYGFSWHCKQMLDHEIRRLRQVQFEVDARQTKEEPPVKSPISVIDSWFTRSYEGINHWFDLRSREGPPMDSSSLNDLQKHITNMQEIVNRERVRRN